MARVRSSVGGRKVGPSPPLLLLLVMPLGVRAEFRLANQFGEHMVLQRDVPATIFGVGAAKSVTLRVGESGAPVAGTVAASGDWEVKTPALTAGSHGTIVIETENASTIRLTDVLFGDVFLCSGQSNMVFAASQAYTAAEDIAAANASRYRSIRLFTSTPRMASAPQSEFPDVEQQWVPASSTSIDNPKAFSYFSSVCWLTGKSLFDRLSGTAPLGLVCSAFGGTRVHQWSGPHALAQCNQSSTSMSFTKYNQVASDLAEQESGDSGLWNAMIYPLLRLQLKGIFWLQGESDVNPSDTVMEPQRGGLYYRCAIRAMVTDWRTKFATSDLPFMWVQLSPWVGHEAATSYEQLPSIRDAQTALNSLPLTGFASAIDLGDTNPTLCTKPDTPPGCNPWGGVHWRNKRPVGDRLAAVALKLLYNGTSIPTLGPSAKSAVATGSTVTIRFTQASISSGLVLQSRLCPFFALEQPDNVARCGWLELRGDGNWSNASFSIANNAVVIFGPEAASANEVRYAWADWPVATIYNGAGLPATPFWLNVTR